MLQELNLFEIILFTFRLQLFIHGIIIDKFNSDAIIFTSHFNHDIPI